MDRNLHCSFCGRSEHEVAKLVAGPNVYICDTCIHLATAIIDSEAGAPPVDTPGRSRIAQPFRALLSWLGAHMPYRSPRTAIRV